ncbi:hypothetical protein C8R44DRAFT_830103 [Mycena epipterygia]|nr:hypothetical protein C8R44DRAFT_830103 [Mycena epipterygia]
MPIVQCQYCKIPLAEEALIRYQAHAPACKKKCDEYITSTLLVHRRRRSRSPAAAPPPAPATELSDAPMAAQDDFMDVDMPEQSVDLDSEGLDLDVDARDLELPVVRPSAAPSAHNEDTEAEEDDGYEEPYPEDRKADDQILTGCEVLGPFADEEEWELAKWLIKNVGHNQTEAFLKLPIVTDRVRPSFDKKRTFLDTIDSLPIGANWNINHIPLTGDVLDEDGEFRTETAELWFRDPVECVKELIGNPAFKELMDYAPTRLFVDAEGNEELINEMSSASWWWKMQTRLPDGSTCAPIILFSDKTRLSQQRGDKTAWPVYITIGNIAKDTRRKASSHATILLGYLPTPKLDCFSDATCSVAKYRLFHYCMGLIMQSLADAGTNGVEMTCADGFLRHVYPILAAYVADYPEQCLVACCMENRCPICKVLPKERGDHAPHPKRDVDEALDYINRYEREHKNAQFKQDFGPTLGLRPVQPFWAGLPHTDIFEAFTPDILHQLHKGAFKDHLVSWCTTTGGKHKEMEKVFAGLVAGHAEPGVIKTATAVIDFIYLASLELHTTKSLAALDTALDVFHENKHIFLTLGARANQGHFNIPKIHSMEHYTSMIRLFGSADGFNTEAPERLHIDYAKAGYRASNKKDYIAQMTLWFTAYLAWCEASLHLKPHSTIPPTPTPPASIEPAEITRIDAPPKPVSPTTVVSVVAYKIAKTHPTELRNIPASVIADTTGINAQQFLPAVATHLQKLGSQFIPQSFDRFDLFKHITITLPSIRQNVVRASPPVATVLGTRNNGERAYQDFALVRTGERNAVTDGTALEGLRVTQVRVLFKFPAYYPAPFDKAKPLAYIEWFTPFSRPEADSDLFVVRRSTRQQRPYVELVDLDRIARNCFLVPRSGVGKTDRRWTTEAVTELCPAFYFNPHLDTHTFCMLKLDQHGCI